jgi:hypothetical protein
MQWDIRDQGAGAVLSVTNVEVRCKQMPALGAGLAGVVTPRKQNKAARNRDNWQKKRAGNVLDDDKEPALLGVERAQRLAKKVETKGRAPSAAKAGRTAGGAGAVAKAIKEINLEEWTTKRRASTPVKGGAQDRQGDVCNDASATTVMMAMAPRQCPR